VLSPVPGPRTNGGPPPGGPPGTSKTHCRGRFYPSRVGQRDGRGALPDWAVPGHLPGVQELDQDARAVHPL